MSQEVTYPAISVAAPVGGATAANQTNGNQKTQIVDGSGNVVGTTSNALDVNVVSGGGSNSSVSPTGSAVPADATMVGGTDGTNLRALSVNASGQLNINNVSGTVSLPTGASTAALQTTGNTSLSSIDTKTPALGQAAMAASTPVAIASNQSAIPSSQSGTWNITNISGTVSLPTGAATAAKQPALGTAGSASADVITVQGISSMTPLLVNGSGSTQPVSGTVTANQGGTWNITNISGTVSLPTGAATAANQSTANSSLSSIDGKTPALGQAAMAASTPVVIASNQSTISASQPGRARANAPVLNDNASVNITTAAYVQLVASTTSASNAIEVFNTCASYIYLATGAPASEVDQILIPPGGNGLIPLAIAASTRVSVKAADVNATTGKVGVNFYA